jgi:hypothetical protein
MATEGLMVLSWQVPYSAEALTRTFQEKGLEMYRQEVRYRAGLLMRLGYSKEDVASRCRAYLTWDYALHGRHPILSELDALLGEVYGRNALHAAGGRDKPRR